MDMKFKKILCVALGLGVSLGAFANEKPKWMTEGPYVDEEIFSIELPLEVISNKLFVDIELGGATRRFLFDTGSTSMISQDLANELKLKVIDKAKGRDSHGAIVETNIVQSDLILGGTSFHKVPIFVAEFPKTAQCLFDGVIGSELLPLCTWQIDLPESMLRCSTDISKLSHLEKATKQSLYSFGYPYTPILDIQLADEAKSKAMFDTGSPEYFTISSPDFNGAMRNGGVGKKTSGKGSMGGSIGGVAQDKEQLKVALNSFWIGNIELGQVDAPVRELSPSLIGASLLEHFIVTLDIKNSTAYFDQYRDGPYVRASYGLGVNYEEQRAKVSLIWEDSPADKAGLRLGQQISAINEQPTDTTCDGIRNGMQAFSEGSTVKLELDGKTHVLKRELN